jgi:LacI family transcriptional regulator
MAQRTCVLVLGDLRAAVPTTVQPFAGIDRFVQERGLAWDLIVEPRPPALRSKTGGFDAIIGRLTAPAAALARRHRLPLVNTWTSSPVRGVPAVMADHEAAGRMAAEFLVERGLRRLVYVGANPRFSQLLAKGMREAAKSLRAEYADTRESWWFDRDAASFDRFMKRINRLVASLQPPVGLLAFDDFTARYVVRACADHGLAVPGDVFVLGLTNNVIACLRPPPALSSIDLNLELVGYQAAKLLADLLAGKPPPGQPILVPPLGVVPRQSTDHYVSGDDAVSQALRFISAHHAGPLRIGQIARHVATSERTLQRRFVAAVGHSVVREILLQRVRRAKQLLVDTDRLVKQIARECGFPDSQRFCRTFQRIEGMSPMAYRRRYTG